MDNILPENEYTEVEGRAYLNPQVALDESNTFIDNLRATQGRQNQEIFTDTQRLGTNAPSNIGGLTGANSYFTSRYQVPQTNANVANLRATAQAAALNQVLANEQEKWKKRYQDAYRAQQRSAYNKANSSGGVGLTGGTTLGGINQNNTGEQVSSSFVDTTNPVTYDMDIGTSAGWGELSDWWTHEYNFTLPGGTQLELGGWDEELKLGSDGNYYVYNTKNQTYTPINLGGEGSTSGGSRWWQR